MSPRVSIALFFSVLAVAGCARGSENLYRSEVRFLREDVVDLMTIVFQTGENGFEGDVIEPEDVVGVPGPGNGFTAIYDLPPASRTGLGFGSGRATLRVSEEGVPLPEPLLFSFGATSALEVVVTYELRYQGRAAHGRHSDFVLTATLDATRATALEPFLVEYFIEGHCELGVTLCEVQTRFRALGRPRDGLVPEFGDADGFIDDPEVFDFYELDLDFFEDVFRAQGDVGCCGYFEEVIRYSEVL